MPVVRRIGIGWVGVAVMVVVMACQPASGDQTLSTVAATSIRESADVVVWGRVPYCNCLADSATDHVASALQAANLSVRLQEQSPRDGWLYFAVTFDPLAATQEQVDAALLAGGAEVLEGPP